MTRAARLLARSLAAFTLAVTGWSGCDDAPGPLSPTAAPPALSDLDLSPQLFTYTGSDATVTVPIQISVAVDEGDGGVTARYVVRRQFESEVLAEGLLTPSGDRYTASTQIEVARGAVGLYVVTAVAVGAGGVGNEVTALLTFASDDLGPPVVVSASSDPPQVASPGSFTVSAEVSDPDGAANIARVELSSGGAEFQLCDDGGAGVCGFGGTDTVAPSGDATADDGRFSRRFQIPSGQEPGDIGFLVQAYDRAGQASEPTLLVVTIQ